MDMAELLRHGRDTATATRHQHGRDAASSPRRQRARRHALRRITAVLIETVVITDLFERRDLSRSKTTLWFSGISRFPRLGTVAYVAARPQTRAWLARVRASAERHRVRQPTPS